MTYKLDDDRRKLITEKLLGECWEEMSAGVVQINKFGMPYTSIPNRTFTTDTDMMTVFRKLVDLGKWEAFVSWKNITPRIFLRPERFCWLVSAWMKEVEK